MRPCVYLSVAGGYQVVSLGYAEGPSGRMSHLTLVNQSRVGFATLLEDMQIALGVGFRHYITTGTGTF